MDQLARLKVGAKCEAMMREKAEIIKKKTISEALSELQELHEKANQLPIEKRSTWLATEAGEDHIDDAYFTLQSIQELDDDVDPAKTMQIKIKRPWRVRQEIIKKVAAERSLSERLVTSCWNEYKKFQSQSKRGLT